MTNIRLYYFLIEVHLRVFDIEPDLPWSHDPHPRLGSQVSFLICMTPFHEFFPDCENLWVRHSGEYVNYYDAFSTFLLGYLGP